MSSRLSGKRSAILALVAVLGIKMAVLWQLGWHPLLQPAGELDGAYYKHFADMVAGGDIWLSSPQSFLGQSPAAFFLSPLYVYFLALCLSVSGGALETARVVQLVLGTGAVLLIALSTRRWFGTRAAWIGGALAALCGIFTFYEVLILPAALEPFLTALDLYLIGRAVDSAESSAGRNLSSGVARWALAGAAMGLHALNNPVMLVVYVGIAIGVLFVGRDFSLAVRPELKFRPTYVAAAFVLAALVVIAPVTIRNYAVAGRFALITSNVGLNVLAGNGEEATGVFARAADVVPNISGRWLSSGQSGAYWKQSFSWMSEHPHAAVRLLVKKTWYALSASFITLNHSFPFFARDLKGPLTFLVAGPALIVPLGLVGLIFCGPRRRGYRLWAAYVPLSIAATVALYVAARFRLPYQVALAGAAGGAISFAIDRLRERNARALAVPAAVGAALALVVLWPTRLEDGRAEEAIRMGLVELQTGRVAEGEAWVQRGLARGASPGLVHVRVGQVYETQSRPAEAITHYRQALVTDPKEPTIHFVLGRALMASGDMSAAIRELAGARVGQQQDAASRLLVIALAKSNRQQEVNTVIRDLDPKRWNADQARQFAAAIAEAGRVDLSIPAWQRAAELTGNVRDYERLGLAWAMVGRGTEALAALEHAVKIDNSIAAVRHNYGAALAAAGRYLEARAEAEAALKIDPDYQPAKLLLEGLRNK
jgi:tetratricopeptide (TPR) repeat protein